MTEETKEALKIVLELLKSTCIDCGVSIAVNKENGDLNFFDTETYLRDKKFDGIKVSIHDLVNKNKK